MSRTDEHPPILSVFGGKITTYRKLAEQGIEQLCQVLGMETSGWTHLSPLPGGDIDHADFEQFLCTFRDHYPWLSDRLSRHYARNYGTRACQILGTACDYEDLGPVSYTHLTLPTSDLV